MKIDDDAIAAIKTSGIIGDKYVSIALGPGDRIPQADGDTIRQTQSAFVLEDAIGQLINNSGGGGSSDKESKSSARRIKVRPDTNAAKKPTKSDRKEENIEKWKI